MAPGNYRYPQVRTPFRRQVHAPPSPVSKFGSFAWTRDVQKNRSTREVSGNGLGAFHARNYKSLKRNALDLPLRYRTDRKVDEDELQYVEEKEKEVSLEDVNLKNGSLMVVDDEKSSFPVTDVSSFEAYRKILKSAENRTSKLKDRGFGDALKERCRGLIRSLRSFFIIQDEEPVEVFGCLFPLILT